MPEDKSPFARFFVDEQMKLSIIKDFAAKAGIPVVDVPLAEITPDGILMFRGIPIEEPKL